MSVQSYIKPFMLHFTKLSAIIKANYRILTTENTLDSKVYPMSRTFLENSTVGMIAFQNVLVGD